MPDASSNGVCVRVSRVQLVALQQVDDRLRVEAAALTHRIAAVEREAGLRAEAHAELPAELVAWR